LALDKELFEYLAEHLSKQQKEPVLLQQLEPGFPLLITTRRQTRVDCQQGRERERGEDKTYVTVSSLFGRNSMPVPQRLMSIARCWPMLRCLLIMRVVVFKLAI
jgi:hypothetical protein